MTPIVIDDRPRCPTCGHVVNVQNTDEGPFYEPDERELEAELQQVRDYVGDLDGREINRLNARVAELEAALTPERLAKALMVAANNGDREITVTAYSTALRVIEALARPESKP